MKRSSLTAISTPADLSLPEGRDHFWWMTNDVGACGTEGTTFDNPIKIVVRPPLPLSLCPQNPLASPIPALNPSILLPSLVSTAPVPNLSHAPRFTLLPL
jgi:hypothetical protein